MRRVTIAVKLSVLALISGTFVALATPAGAAPQERSTYLVTFVDGTNARAEAAQLRAQNFVVSHVYENLFPGVAVELPAAAAQALANNPRVALVEPDGIATVSDTQSSATWGLDRVDQRALPLDSSFTYPTSAGTGVTAYIIDTGVLISHNEFGGRARSGYDAFGGSAIDCNGHGTHVAGTVAGSTWGLAKKANVVAVRVLDCSGSGSWSGVVAGMDWVAANHTKPAVANMSLGGGASSTVDAAVQRLVDAGVTVVVAAGNDNADACNASPARAAAAITVGSTTSSDSRSSFSNYGTCVDIFAPGSSITSSWYTSNSATAVLSGTSMASPHVAGASALVLGSNTTMTPADVLTSLVNSSTPNVVTSPGTGSPNRLLFAESGPTGPQPLTVGTTALPDATLGVAYSATLSGWGGTGPYTWSATSVPAGLTVGTNGTVSGTPTASGSFTFTATITDAASGTAQSTVSLRVLAPPAAFSKLSPSSGVRLSSRYVATLTWGASTRATSYQVCVSRTTSCTSWTSVGTSTSSSVSGLRSNTTYYWQVRALNADGTTIANSGTLWRFTTAR